MPYKVLFISNISEAPFTTIADRMLVQGLSSMGVDITVITPAVTPETLETERSGIKVIYLPIEKKISFRAIKKIRGILREGRFNILHITYGKAATNGILASLWLKIKVVAYYGSLSLHWHDPSAYLAFLNPKIDRIICNSEAVSVHVKKQLPPGRRNRVVKIYRGYDPSWFDTIEPVTRESLRVSPDEFLVCSVGNLRKVKGIRFLIDSMKFLPQDMKIRILLVGAGTNSDETRKMTSETGRPDIFILQGPVGFSPSYMVPCDLYVQPSLSEGLGRAISEAMCLGKPVIVTDGGGAKEFFAAGDNGFIVKRGSTEAIAEAIINCYKNRDSLHLTGNKARESMLNEFNNRHTVFRTYEVYRNLLEG